MERQGKMIHLWRMGSSGCRWDNNFKIYFYFKIKIGFFFCRALPLLWSG